MKYLWKIQPYMTEISVYADCPRKSITVMTHIMKELYDINIDEYNLKWHPNFYYGIVPQSKYDEMYGYDFYE
jgi:hypothetical protein